MLPSAEIDPEYNHILFFRASPVRRALLLAACLVFLPLAPFLYWYPLLYAKLALKRVLLPSLADYVLVKGPNGRWERVVVHRETVKKRTFLTFEFRRLKYMLNGDRFVCVERKLSGERIVDLHARAPGLSTSEANRVMRLNGENAIDLQPQPLWQLCLHKLFHPFYFFQITSVNVWFYNGYMVYACVVGALSFLSAAWEIYSAKKNEENLRRLVKVDHSVLVLRDGALQKMDSRQLVIGDAVLLESNTPVVCDMILVSGEVVVDESSLTGETAPVVKTCLPTYDSHNEFYNPAVHRPNTLFSGSKITHIRERNDKTLTIAIVMATGFGSTKGELFRSILYPKEIDFKFNRQSYIFLIIMVVVAISAFTFKLVQGYVFIYFIIGSSV